MPGRNVLESISGTYAFEVPRNWKQAPTIFWLLPAWSSELETGMSHFFRSCPAWSSAWSSQSWDDNRIEGGNPGVTTGLKEAILEFFFWESLGAGSDAGQARPGFYAGQPAIGKKSCRSSPHTTTSTFWGGLDFIFSWYAGQAGLCRAGSPKLSA